MALPPMNKLKLEELTSCMMVVLQQQQPLPVDQVQQELCRLQDAALAQAIGMIQGRINPTIPYYYTPSSDMNKLLHEFASRLKEALLKSENTGLLAQMLHAPPPGPPMTIQPQPMSPGMSSSNGLSLPSSSMRSMYNSSNANQQQQQQFQQLQQEHLLLPPSPIVTTNAGLRHNTKSPTDISEDYSESSRMSVGSAMTAATTMTANMHDIAGGNIFQMKNYSPQPQSTTTTTTPAAGTATPKEQPSRRRSPSPSSRPTTPANTTRFTNEQDFINYCRLFIAAAAAAAADNTAPVSCGPNHSFIAGLEACIHAHTIITVGMQLHHGMADWDARVKEWKVNRSGGTAATTTTPTRSNTTSSSRAAASNTTTPAQEQAQNATLLAQGNHLASLIADWKTKVEQFGARFLVNAEASVEHDMDALFQADGDLKDDDNGVLAKMPPPTKPVKARGPPKKRTVVISDTKVTMKTTPRDAGKRKQVEGKMNSKGLAKKGRGATGKEQQE